MADRGDVNYFWYRTTTLTVHDGHIKWPPTVDYHRTITDDSILLSTLYCYTLHTFELYSCQISKEAELSALLAYILKRHCAKKCAEKCAV